MPAKSVFVGRELELAALLAGLEGAAAGRGSLFLIGGEPGIAKSRLVDELATRAAAHEPELSGVTAGRSASLLALGPAAPFPCAAGARHGRGQVCYAW